MEDRLILFVGHLANKMFQFGTIKSYVSAIRTTLQEIRIPFHEDRFLLQSLTKACTLNNDRLKMRFPIHKEILNIILRKIETRYHELGQPYLAVTYKILFWQHILVCSELDKSQKASCDMTLSAKIELTHFAILSSRDLNCQINIQLCHWVKTCFFWHFRHYKLHWNYNQSCPNKFIC